LESPYLNNLLHFVSQDPRYNGELTAAKEEFQQFAGTIFESDRNYLARINSFHNWYVLDRPLASVGKTPVQYFLEFNANSLRQEERQGYEDLSGNIHSLFEVLKTTPTEVRVRDVFSRLKHSISMEEQALHLDRGALFNTRLFNHSQRFYFANYFIVHPAEVGKRILAEARKVRKAGGDVKAFLYLLLLFQSRWDQYKQMDIRNIYRFAG
jgi:hypothetical protein